MRPGHLGNTTYWFNKGFSGEYFEIEEVYSSEPTYHLRGRVRGRTGQETKTKIPRTWSSLLIPRRTIVSKYKLAPYGRSRRRAAAIKNYPTSAHRVAPWPIEIL